MDNRKKAAVAVDHQPNKQQLLQIKEPMEYAWLVRLLKEVVAQLAGPQCGVDALAVARSKPKLSCLETQP